ncbi:hypothetical protein ASG49_12280 [Marmoricola sp. Leaf446]|nr:hypothetical protein ASG49_12280 [Marmoricola sp. Leaf446]
MPVTLLALALTGTVLAGCGGGDDGRDGSAEPAAEEVDPQDAACRTRWRALADEVGDRSQDEHPSTLAGRWTSVSATIDYYAVSGSASDCEKTLDAQRAQVAALEELGTALRRYDVLYQHDRLAEDAAAYTPPKARKGQDEPPSRKAVRAALGTLEEQAPRAEKDQLAGWQQATAIDPTEKKSVAKAKKDLAFLSQESAAWRRASAAQRTIERGLRAAG